MFKSTFIALFLTIAVNLSGQQQARSQSISRSISGSVTINDEHYGFAGKPCNPYRKSFEDLKFGFEIVVKNGKGDILATANAPTGSLIETGKVAGTTELRVKCLVSVPSFKVPDSDFYSIEIAGRRAIVRSRAQLEADKWMLDLEIGR